MTIDPAHHIYKIQLNENVFLWNLFISKFSSAAPITRTTDTIKHPTEGYNMKWCKLCGPGCCKGTPAGMYMHAPHDHAKWLLSKKESLSKFNAKNKSLKAKKTKAGDDNNSTNNNTKHLKLSDSIINDLTTDIMIGDSEAQKIAKCWFENANKGTSDQADSLVKD